MYQKSNYCLIMVLLIGFIGLFSVTAISAHSMEMRRVNLNVTVTDDSTTFSDLSNKIDYDTTENRQLAVRWQYTMAAVNPLEILVQTNRTGEYEPLARLENAAENLFLWDANNPAVNEKFRNGPQFFHFYQFKIIVLAEVNPNQILFEATNSAPVYFGKEWQEHTCTLSRMDERQYQRGPDQKIPKPESLSPEIIQSSNTLIDHKGGDAAFFQYYKGYYYTAQGGVLSIYDRMPSNQIHPIFSRAIGKEILDFKIIDDYILLAAIQYPNQGLALILDNEMPDREIARIPLSFDPSSIEYFDGLTAVGGSGDYDSWNSGNNVPDPLLYHGIIQIFDMQNPPPLRSIFTRYTSQSVLSIKNTGGYLWIGTEGNTILTQWMENQTLQELDHIPIGWTEHVLSHQDAYYLGGQTYGPAMISLANPKEADVLKQMPFISMGTMIQSTDGIIMGINPQFSFDPQPQIVKIDYNLDPNTLTTIASIKGGSVNDLSLSPEGYCAALGNKGIHAILNAPQKVEIDLNQHYEPIGFSTYLIHRPNNEFHFIEFSTLPATPDQTDQKTSIIYSLNPGNDSLKIDPIGQSPAAFQYFKIVPLGENGYLAVLPAETLGYQTLHGNPGTYIRIDHLNESWEIQNTYYLEIEPLTSFDRLKFDMTSEYIACLGGFNRYDTFLRVFQIKQQDGGLEFLPIQIKLPDPYPNNIQVVENRIVTSHEYGEDSIVTFWEADPLTNTFRITNQHAHEGKHDIFLAGIDKTYVLLSNEADNTTLAEFYETSDDGSVVPFQSLRFEGHFIKYNYDDGRFTLWGGNRVLTIPMDGKIMEWTLPGVTGNVHVLENNQLLASVYMQGWFLLSAEPLSGETPTIQFTEEPGGVEEPLWRRVTIVLDRTNNENPQQIRGARILCDSQDTLYVLDSEAGTIHALNRDSILMEIFNPPPFSSAVQPLSYPMDFHLHGNTLLITDTNHNTIRALDLETNQIRTIAGTGQTEFNGDGKQALLTNINAPSAVCSLEDGTILFAEGGGKRIRAILPDGTIQHIAGAGIDSPVKAGFKSYTGAIVNSVTVDIGTPMDLVLYQNKLYFTSQQHSLVGEIDLSKKNLDDSYPLKVLLGGRCGDESEIEREPVGHALRFPEGLSITQDGRLFVCDSGNNRILESDLQGNVLCSYGGKSPASYGNGFPDFALHSKPLDVCLDSSGAIYFINGENHIMRKITPTAVLREELDETEITEVRYWKIYEYGFN